MPFRPSAVALARSLVAALVLTLAPALGAITPARAEPVLRVADQKGLQRALLDAAHALDGVPYRIEWSEFAAAAPLLQALGAGAVDTGIAGDGPFLFAHGGGQAVRATMTILPRDGGRLLGMVVPQGSHLRGLGDLAGHVVATTRGSIGHELVLRLQRSGALPASIRLVFLSPAQAAAALHASGVDAWATWEPYVSVEEQAGGHRLDGIDPGFANYSFQVANIQSLAAKHALLQDFYHRLARAYDWGEANPDAYARIWSAQIGLPLDIARKVAGAMRTHEAPVGDAVIAAEGGVLDLYRTAGVLPVDGPSLGDAFDRSFTP